MGAPTRATPRARAHVRRVAPAGADGGESAPAVRSHKVRWEEKYAELAAFVREHGHASAAVEAVIVERLRRAVDEAIGGAGNRKRIGFGVRDGVDHTAHLARIPAVFKPFRTPFLTPPPP